MIVGMIFAVIFLGAAIFISIHKLIEVRRVTSMHTWTKVNGKILSNNKSRESDGDGGFNQMQTLTYTYNIEGNDYTGDLIWCADNNPPNMKFTKHVSGQRIDVLYNPSNKNESVLEKFDQKQVFNSMWFALFFLILGGISIWLDWYNE